MKFDYVIGNPPYQEEIKDTSDKPIYHYFMDVAYKISDRVELITPARFLFNIGKTPKEWNNKILNDEHFKVLRYEPDWNKIFLGTEIKGGIVISYRDSKKMFNKIGVFLPYSELKTILNNVVKHKNFISISSIMFAQSSYRFSDYFKKTMPNEINKLKDSAKNFLASNVFDILGENVFYDKKPIDKNEYIRIIGRVDNKRRVKWIKKDFLDFPDNFDSYKLLIPKTNGNGLFGETLASPELGNPFMGHTQTFMSIGSFETKNEVVNCWKYLKTKFARCLLSILKKTQDNPPSFWEYVPLQDFSNHSQKEILNSNGELIDWSKTIHEIDLQLYKKYNLINEIDFIETHVKEMDDSFDIKEINEE